jgi:hypothetical protein
MGHTGFNMSIFPVKMQWKHVFMAWLFPNYYWFTTSRHRRCLGSGCSAWGWHEFKKTGWCGLGPEPHVPEVVRQDLGQQTCQRPSGPSTPAVTPQAAERRTRRLGTPPADQRQRHFGREDQSLSRGRRVARSRSGEQRRSPAPGRLQRGPSRFRKTWHKRNVIM